MRNLKNILFGFIAVSILLLVMLSFLKKNGGPATETIIFTAIPADNHFDHTRFPEQSKIFQINAPDNEPALLTHGFSWLLKKLIP